jgi:hypothetical protein
VDDWDQGSPCNFKTILYPQWRVYRLGSGTAQSRELWISSEQLTNADGSLSNAFLASPGRLCPIKSCRRAEPSSISSSRSKKNKTAAPNYVLAAAEVASILSPGNRMTGE